MKVSAAALAWALLLVAACDLPPNDRAPSDPLSSPDGGATDGGGDGASPGAASYTIVVLPDTQYYASSWPEIFAAQTRWIVENRQPLGIAFVLHTGDLVDMDVAAEWQVASQSLHALDGQVPYLVTAGNHDYMNLADRTGMIESYFSQSSFAQFPWFGDTFEPGHIENSFSILSAGSERWLVIALEFGPRNEVLDWAGNVLASFPQLPAIIITHAYLYRDGTRYDANVTPHQEFNPHDYIMMGQPGTSINDGEEIWQKLVLPHRNVKLVLSGHDVSGSSLPPGTCSRLTSARPDGTTVHQLLANFQTCTDPPCAHFAGRSVHGGNGFLRTLRFAPDRGTITVSTYSPYLNESLDDPSNSFELPLN